MRFLNIKNYNLKDFKDNPIQPLIYVIVFEFLLSLIFGFGYAIFSYGYKNSSSAFNIGGGIKVIALSMLISIASFAVGSIVGFILGIPKRFAGITSESNEVTPNTNLEQISDWLTKVFIGFTLAKLKTVQYYANLFGNNIQDAFACEVFGLVYGISIIVAFFILGFLFTYLVTTLYMPSAYKNILKIETTTEIKADLLQKVTDNPKLDTKEFEEILNEN